MIKNNLCPKCTERQSLVFSYSKAGELLKILCDSCDFYEDSQDILSDSFSTTLDFPPGYASLTKQCKCGEFLSLVVGEDCLSKIGILCECSETTFFSLNNLQ